MSIDTDHPGTPPGTSPGSPPGTPTGADAADRPHPALEPDPAEAPVHGVRVDRVVFGVTAAIALAFVAWGFLSTSPRDAA